MIIMAFQDQTLTCRDCGNPFVWTASEQEFYQQKGFQNAPVRCPADRAAKKSRMEGGRGGDRGQRQMYDITCSNCGRQDQVPFQPRGDRPVLCGDCFRRQREGGLPQAEAPRVEEAKAEEPKAEEAPTEESAEPKE